jgi:hypothetical protein
VGSCVCVCVCVRAHVCMCVLKRAGESDAEGEDNGLGVREDRIVGQLVKRMSIQAPKPKSPTTAELRSMFLVNLHLLMHGKHNITHTLLRQRPSLLLKLHLFRHCQWRASLGCRSYLLSDPRLNPNLP